MFDHIYLQSISKIWWGQLDEVTTLEICQFPIHRLHWLGHVLRIFGDRIPMRGLFVELL